ncbi:unnamed protein product [Pylaiella littoralis]
MPVCACVCVMCDAPRKRYIYLRGGQEVSMLCRGCVLVVWFCPLTVVSTRMAVPCCLVLLFGLFGLATNDMPLDRMGHSFWTNGGVIHKIRRVVGVYPQGYRTNGGIRVDRWAAWRCEAGIRA